MATETAIRFYTDEHIAYALVHGLRQRGIDVLTVQSAGMLGASDQEHLEFARADGLVIVTQDADFLRLAVAGHPHSGIAYAAQGTSVRKMIQGLSRLHLMVTADEMIGHIEFL